MYASGLTSELRAIHPVCFAVATDRVSKNQSQCKKKTLAEAVDAAASETPTRATTITKEDWFAGASKPSDCVVDICDFPVPHQLAFAEADEYFSNHPEHWEIAKALIGRRCRWNEKHITSRMLSWFVTTYCNTHVVTLPPRVGEDGKMYVPTVAEEMARYSESYPRRVLCESRRGARCLYKGVVTAPCQLLWCSRILKVGIFDAYCERFDEVQRAHHAMQEQKKRERASVATGSLGGGASGSRGSLSSSATVPRKRKSAAGRRAHVVSLHISPTGTTVYSDGTVCRVSPAATAAVVVAASGRKRAREEEEDEEEEDDQQ